MKLNHRSLSNVYSKRFMTRFTTISRDTRVVKETWDSKQTADPVNPRSRRTRANAPAYNEVFKHMATVIGDPFWKDQFTDAVTGTFPPKISYCNGVMQYRGVEDATLMLQTDVHEDDMETLATQSMMVIHFYQTYVQLYSPTDVQQMNAAISPDEMTEEAMGCVWNKIKQKQQDLALHEFIRDERQRRGLTREQALQLEQIINVCKQLKYTNASTIKVSRFRIISQSFVLYDEEKQMYYINPTLVAPIRIRVQKKKLAKQKPTYFEKWLSLHAQIAQSEKDIVRHYRQPPGTEVGETEETTTFTNVTS